ncbi:hypothetical protein [Luteimonas aquatica]|uniref:hypothetical protein n=1 Tax=Luteimonas aquatica TaxID=450364 RepID=UPI001F59AD07|nr:hypothetical protein [Luteimonas aquatica]
MKKTTLRAIAIALTLCVMSAPALAFSRPTIPCTPELQGTIVATPTSSGYVEWECGNGSWHFFLQWVCDPRGGCIPL